METTVQWNAGGGSLNKEVGTQRGVSLNKEVKWRQ